MSANNLPKLPNKKSFEDKYQPLSASDLVSEHPDLAADANIAKALTERTKRAKNYFSPEATHPLASKLFSKFAPKQFDTGVIYSQLQTTIQAIDESSKFTGYISLTKDFRDEELILKRDRIQKLNKTISGLESLIIKDLNELTPDEILQLPLLRNLLIGNLVRSDKAESKDPKSIKLDSFQKPNYEARASQEILTILQDPNQGKNFFDKEYSVLKKIIEARYQYSNNSNSNDQIQEQDPKPATKLDLYSQAITKAKAEIQTIVDSSPELWRESKFQELKSAMAHSDLGVIITPSIQKHLDEIGSIIGKRVVFLHGPTGSGKTQLAELYSRIYGHQEPEVISASKYTEPSELFGSLQLTAQKSGINEADYQAAKDKLALELSDIAETKRPKEQKLIQMQMAMASQLEKVKGESLVVTEFVEGIIYQCIEEGKVLILDEFNKFPAGMINVFNKIFSDIGSKRDSGNLTIAVQQSPTKRKINIHPKFGVILTGNLNDEGDSRYSVNPIAADVTNRLHKIEVNYPPQSTEDLANPILSLTQDKFEIVSSGKEVNLAKIVTQDNTHSDKEIYELILLRLIQEQGNTNTLSLKNIPVDLLPKLWNFSTAVAEIQEVFTKKQLNSGSGLHEIDLSSSVSLRDISNVINRLIKGVVTQSSQGYSLTQPSFGESLESIIGSLIIKNFNDREKRTIVDIFDKHGLEITEQSNDLEFSNNKVFVDSDQIIEIIYGKAPEYTTYPNPELINQKTSDSIVPESNAANLDQEDEAKALHQEYVSSTAPNLTQEFQDFLPSLQQAQMLMNKVEAFFKKEVPELDPTKAHTDIDSSNLKSLTDIMDYIKIEDLPKVTELVAAADAQFNLALMPVNTELEKLRDIMANNRNSSNDISRAETHHDILLKQLHDITSELSMDKLLLSSRVEAGKNLQLEYRQTLKQESQDGSSLEYEPYLGETNYQRLLAQIAHISSPLSSDDPVAKTEAITHSIVTNLGSDNDDHLTPELQKIRDLLCASAIHVDDIPEIS